RDIADGLYRGPLHGVPVALKDLFFTAGIRTTAGSKILRDFVPDEDATVVTRLRKAGAIMVGKLNLHEFAYGATNINPHFGDVHNPWALDRAAGGSSGGSGAAVAARMASAALGTDTGGSIRTPASFCGIFGLKPTYGRVSRHGSIPCAWSMDHIGPMTRTAEDAAFVLAAIAGYDAKDPATSHEPVADYPSLLARGASGLKLAVLREYVDDPLDPEILAGFLAAVDVLRGLGLHIEEVSVPEVRFTMGASTAIQSVECTAYHEDNLRTRPQDYGPDIRDRLELGLHIAGTDYVRGQRIRRQLTERFGEVFREHDAVLFPMVPITAPVLHQTTVDLAGEVRPIGPVIVQHTRLFNMLGTPAASVPCGFSKAGLPFAFQVGSGPFREAVPLAIAHAFQGATDYHKRVPPVAQ
ncbi:MAG: amidase, partial [Chloroflexota bacterium]